MFILQVTIDGLGHTDHLHAGIMSLVVLGQDGCIGVAVITADNHYSRDFELAQDIQTSLKLFGFLKLGTARTDQVKAASVAVLLNQVTCELNVAVLYQSGRTTQEAIQAAILVQRLDAVIEATDHIVAARSLTTTQDHAHVERILGRHRRIIALKGQLRQTIGAGEQLLNGLLIGHRLGGLSLDRTNRAPQRNG